MCCQKGRVKVPRNHYPPLLQNLMTRNDPISKRFIENIRSINCSFAFASMGANLATSPGYGPYYFRIQGQIYHLTGTLHLDHGENQRFVYLYILDLSDATSERLRIAKNQNFNLNVMKLLASYLEQNISFAKTFEMLRDVVQEVQEEAAQNDRQVPEIVLVIKKNQNQDFRRHNNPRVCKVTGVFENDNGESPYNRNILIHLRSDPNGPLTSRTHRINLSISIYTALAGQFST
ncbi:uncharacterized protein [Diabrotica undecimpunctata]|uniref:uncharacterized protein n=1 Tax=Diabrotica undecimpunctata TaxID=50387 RepID=UPI003B640785